MPCRRQVLACIGGCALAAWAAGAPSAVRAVETVDLALVLVTDVSRSIDDTEFELEKKGYAAAFTSKEVIAAIQGQPTGRIAVSYVEFAGSFEVRTVLDWAIVSDAASARDFAEKLSSAPRSFWGRTAISAGVDRGVQMLAAAEFQSARKVIDVCGDGTNNAGREINAARDDAIAAGVTINGLAIINERPVSWTFAHVQPPGGLAEYYRQNVVGGPGSFVLEVHDFHTFGDAMTRKLISEIASAPMAPARFAKASGAPPWKGSPPPRNETTENVGTAPQGRDGPAARPSQEGSGAGSGIASIRRRV